MSDSRKQKLIDLGAETLAQALLDIAVFSDAADDLIERLIATPDENVKRFQKKLAGLEFLSLWHSLLFWTLIVLSLKTLNIVKMKNDFNVLAGSPTR
jgi:hypothetical protein